MTTLEDLIYHGQQLAATLTPTGDNASQRQKRLFHQRLDRLLAEIRQQHAHSR